MMTITRVGKRKVSKNRYVLQDTIVDVTGAPVKRTIKRVLKSPLRLGLKYQLLTKRALIQTETGQVLQIINKPAHHIPLGIIYSDAKNL